MHRFKKPLYALDALEDPIPVAVPDDSVSSAACWILYARFKLKYNDIGYPKEGYELCKTNVLGYRGLVHTVDQGSLTRRDGCFGRKDLTFRGTKKI
jgi:hypothetical protein